MFVLKITGTEVLNYSGRRERTALPLIVRDEPGRRAAPATDAKADSEIFNKFGRSIESGRCTMRNHDFVSNGFLALIVAGLLLLCSGLLVIAFS